MTKIERVKNMDDKKIVMYDSEESAKVMTVTGWVSSNGRFFGSKSDAEHLARWDGCTHRKCDSCGKLVKKSRLICNECSNKKQDEKYNKMERKEWDKKTPLYSRVFDKYYSYIDTLLDDCEERDIPISEAQLIICEPQNLHQIETDVWYDELPDEIGDEVIPSNVLEALDALNEEIRSCKPISFYPSNYRTTL